MKCLTWNLEWPSPSSRRLGIIRQTIAELDPDVVCYTEITRDIPDGYTIEADADYGYPNTGERRKVILWSKTPWTECDAVGDPDMPSGRYVSGVTGGIRFVGVCIPWRDAHVRTGRKDRKAWEDHLSYCQGLRSILEKCARSGTPTCVLGDFNQRIPKGSQPERLFAELMTAIPGDFRIATKGMKDAEGKGLIDHFAGSPELSLEVEEIIPRFSADGTRLSDHVGVVVGVGLV